MRISIAVITVLHLIVAGAAVYVTDALRGVAMAGETPTGEKTKGGAAPAETAGEVLSKVFGGQRVQGRFLDKRLADRVAAVQQVTYSPDQGVLVRIKKSDLVPATAKPGGVVEARIEYEALAPDRQARVPLTERRVVEKDGKVVITPVERQLQKTQGIHESAYRFRLPADFRPGKYTVVMILETGTGDSAKRVTAQSVMAVE